MLKLSDRMTACAEVLKIYSPPPIFLEVLKCFDKDISVLPISLPTRDLYLSIMARSASSYFARDVSTVLYTLLVLQSMVSVTSETMIRL
jgi:hypothetical protein